MNLSFLLSLQNMSAIKIVTRLWNGVDVVALIAECDEDYYRGECWQEIEKRVHVKISLLRLPTPLKEKLSSFVAPIGDKMRRWKRGHARGFKIKNIPREFRWTSLGTLDKKETAEAFVRDPTLPERERYVMACLYCLEWDDPVPFLETESYLVSVFQAFWTYDRTGDATALPRMIRRYSSETPYQHAFHFAVELDNIVATEYYLHKLNHGEREESLSDVKLYYYFNSTHFDVFRFLLLHMDEGQRLRMLKAHGEEVLQSLLEWPWQPFFLDGARLVGDILRCDQYYRLLSKIVDKIEEEYHDYGYHDLFRRFRMEIPPNYKKKMILEPSCIWNHFLPFIGEKNILLMLKDLSPEEREELLLSGSGRSACRGLARVHQWDLLEVVIRECLSSCDTMIYFKEECKRAKYFGSPFFEWINELIEKRSREEKDCPVPHKTLCSSPGLSTNHT